MKNKVIILVKEKGVLMICLIVLFLVYMYQFGEYNLLYHLGDEFGYWANAAYLNGYDWSGIMSYNEYYSFGYSIILVPLFFIKDFEKRYLAAIFLNLIFQVISFLLLSKIANTLFKTISKNITIIISLCVTLYVSNIFFSKTTLCESILYCTFICITFLIMKISEYGKWTYYILLGMFTPYIFAIHMRSLGVVISVLLFVFVQFFITKSNRKQILIFTLEIIILTVIILAFKEKLLDSLYLSKGKINTNDFNGQVGKLHLLLSIDGIFLMVKSIIGKIYYLLSASFLIIAWAVVWIWEQKFFYFERRAIKFSDNVQNKLALFLFAVLVFTVSISGISTIYESDRLDILIYGRYNEFIIGPYLLIGFCCLLNKKSLIKKWLWITLGYFVCVFFVINTFNNVESPRIIEATIVGVIYMSYNGEICLYDKWEIVITLKALIVSVLLMSVISLNKIKVKICSFIVVAMIWVYGGIWLLDYQGYIRDNYYTCKNLSDYLNENNINNITYVTNEKYGYFDYYRADILQYMNPDLEINCKDIADISINKEETFFVRKGYFEKGSFRKYKCVAMSNDFELYVK